MKRRQILFLSQRVPYPPDRGDRITTWNFLRHLAENHDVHLACLASHPGDVQKRSILLPLCRSVTIIDKPVWRAALNALVCLCLSGKPLSCGYYFSGNIKKLAWDLTKDNKIELVYAYSSNVFTHVAGLAGPKIIYHFGDVDSEKWRKMANKSRNIFWPIYQIESRRLRLWEIESSKSCSASVFATEKEAGLFRSLGGSGRIVAIGNGVDHGFFSGGVDEPKQNFLIFTGVMNYFPNVDTVITFCREVFPKVKEKFPDTKFLIVGANPTGEVLALAQEDENCIVTGYVEDIRPYMRKAKVFVAPMRVAQGIQNKILEALAMELPVITYPEIASSTGLSENEGVIGARDAEEMAVAIERLMNEEDLRKKLGKTGRESVIEKFSWDNQLKKLDDLVEAVMGEP